MKPFTLIVPFVVFVGVAVALFLNLDRASQAPVSADLVDRLLPDVGLEAIAGEGRAFAVKDVRGRRVSLVNVWASWCAPCRLEAPQLRLLAARKDIDLYGVAFKDTPDRARVFLAEVGQPYIRVAIDRAGHTAKLWDVHGAQQTFVVDGHGIVRASRVRSRRSR